VNGLYESRNDPSGFKNNIRDFLVQSKEFSAQVLNLSFAKATQIGFKNSKPNSRSQFVEYLFFRITKISMLRKQLHRERENVKECFQFLGLLLLMRFKTRWWTHKIKKGATRRSFLCSMGWIFCNHRFLKSGKSSRKD